MARLTLTALLALGLAATVATGAQARVQAAPRGALVLMLTPQAVIAAPQRVAAGSRAVVVHNRSAADRDVRIVRVEGGTAALVRFEGFRFLPAGSRIVADLGRVAYGGVLRRTLNLARGRYVVASFAGSAVVAARELTVA